MMEWYSSIAGVVAATILLTGCLKRALARVRWLNEVPVWVYAVLLAAGLTALVNLVFHTLPGDFWVLATQAIMLAASASGFYEWWAAAGKPLKDSDVSRTTRGEPTGVEIRATW